MSNTCLTAANKASPQTHPLRATLALCIGSLMVFANLYTAQPLLPLFVQQFALTELEAAHSLTISTLMLAVSLLVYGPLSDALGRKTIMVASLCGITITTLGLTQVHSFEQLLWLRAAQGFLLGGIPAAAIAYIGEEYPKAKIAATVGLYISANSLGGISGRVISGVISDTWDWQAVFIFMLVFNACVTLFFIMALPSSQSFTAQPLHIKTIISGLIKHLRNKILLLAFIIGGFNFMIFLTLYSYLTFVLADTPYHLSTTWLGLLFLTYLSGTFSSAFIGKIGKRFSCAQRIIIGTSLIIVGSLITLFSSLLFIIIGLTINSFGFFFAHSSLSTWVNRYAVGSKASASSLYLVFYYLGASLGNSYLHPFWEWAQWSGVITGGISTLCLILIACYWLRSKEKMIDNI